MPWVALGDRRGFDGTRGFAVALPNDVTEIEVPAGETDGPPDRNKTGAAASRSAPVARAKGQLPPTLSHRLSADAPLMAGRVSNAASFVSQPAVRDRYMDLLRGLAILCVAIGHWLVVVPNYTNGHFSGENALGTVPLMQPLTWIFQMMPLFFIVGGYANAISWRTAKRKDVAYHDWLRTRLVRLVKPTAVLLGVWTALGVVLRLGGVDPYFVQTLGWLVVVPLWFLAVYVLVVAIAPAMIRAHARWGIGVLVGLALAALFVDWLRIGLRIDGVEYTNFFFVFLFAQQLGFFWLDGRLDRKRWMPVAMFVGGLGSLWILTHVGPYPLSLVGVPGERIANNAPPTITLLALGVAQAGLALMVRRPVTAWLERRRVWSGVVGLNANAMTIHLWHFTALVIASLIILPLGILPVYTAGSGAWWLSRLAMLVVFTIPLAGLVAVFGRVERKQLLAGLRPKADGPKVHETPAVHVALGGEVTHAVGGPGDTRSIVPIVVPTPLARRSSRQWIAVRTARMITATVLFAAAFSVITLRGLSIVSGPLGLPVLGMGLFLAATACLGRHH